LVVYIVVLMMDGHTNIKFINAKQTKGIHLYKNMKRKLYRANATVWYSKTCRDKQLTPNYITSSISTVAPIGSSVDALYQKLYVQSKRAPEDGRICPPKHVGLI